MHKGILSAVFVAAILVASGAAFGQSATVAGYDLTDFATRKTQSLVDICTVESTHPDYHEAQSYCYGFFAGGGAYHDGLVVLDDYDPIVCSPPTVTVREAVDVFITFAKANPQYGNWQAMRTIVRALAERWPCKQ